MMDHVTMRRFRRSQGAVFRAAKTRPVVITQHGRGQIVVMSVDEWSRLKRRDRKVGLTVDLSQEWIDAIKAAKVGKR